MEDKTLNLSKEMLKELSIEQLTDLKVEVDDLLEEIDNLIKKCDDTLDA